MKPLISGQMSRQELGQLKMLFGKYGGRNTRTLQWIFENDKAYIEYMADCFWKEVKDLHRNSVTGIQRFKLRFVRFWRLTQELEERYNAS